MLNASLKKYKGTNGVFPISIDCYKDTYFNSAVLDRANAFINENKNKALYSTICTFNTERKTLENIEEITTHFIDIDSHEVTPTEQELEELKNLILIEAHNGVIPVPSQIINTGRGLGVYFGLKQGANDIAKWNITQKALQGKIDNIVASFNALYGVEPFGVDDKCCNANRLSRITGTYNSKAKKYAKDLYHSNKKYTQEELIKNYGLTYTDNKGKVIDLSNITPEQIINATQTQLKEFTSLYGGYTKDTLRIARLQDLMTLINSRNARNITHGYRENLIYIVSFILKEKQTTIESLYNDLLEYNKVFDKKLEASEIRKHATYCVRSKQIYFTNGYIIELLHITSEEQRHLKTIISRKEKNRRYYETSFYQVIKHKNERKHLAKVNKAKELKAQGKNNTEIAKALKCTPRTVRRMLNGK